MKMGIVIAGCVLVCCQGWCAEPAQPEFPKYAELLKCPKCKAPYEGQAHPFDYRQCAKCQAALEKSMAYLRKHFKPQFFGLILDSFFGGFVFMMDAGDNKKELAVCVKNCRDLIRKNPSGGFASDSVIGEDWCGWKKSMAMFFLTEYSLRYGLSEENKAALLEGAKFATDTQEPGGGWFHGHHDSKPYSPDIAIIGCIYYAAFVEMKSLGVDPGPILDQTRAYLEGVSDGKTIGYAKGWHGGMGGGGADGFITLGLQGAGIANDKWETGLASWMKQNYMDAGHGHANGELHYFGLGAALHRLGPDYYAHYASCQVHRLIEIQKDDGSIPAMAHDTSEIEYYQKAKATIASHDDSSYSATAVLAALIMMESPGTFSSLPSKPAGSPSNKDAFKTASDAIAKADYAKAWQYFSIVLPRGDSGELVPKAREQLEAIEQLAAQHLQELQKKNAELATLTQSKPDARKEIVAYAAVIAAYDKFQKDFAGTSASRDAKKPADALKTVLSNKRMRAVFSSEGVAAEPPAAPAKLKDTLALKEWDGRLIARIKEAIGAGSKPRFDFKSLRTRVTVLSVHDAGFSAGLENGGQMELTWAQLQSDDMRGLALNLAASPGSQKDHALAAFYLLYNKQGEKAEDHLAKSGAEAANVRAAFTMDPAIPAKL